MWISWTPAAWFLKCIRLSSTSWVHSLLGNEQFWPDWNLWCRSKWRCSECLLPKTCFRSHRDSRASSRQFRHWKDWHWSENWHSDRISKSEHFNLISTSDVSSFDKLVTVLFFHVQRDLRECRFWRTHSEIKSSMIRICRFKFSLHLMNDDESKKIWAIQARFSKAYSTEIEEGWTEKRTTSLTTICASISCIEAAVS